MSLEYRNVLHNPPKGVKQRLMRKGTLPLWAGLGLALAILCIAATQNITIHFFTEAPNSVPIGSDFMLFQRNQSYVNSSVSQMKQDWFNNPVFSGNGGIQGVWTAVSFVGDGSQLTGINFSGTNSVINIITNVTFANSNIFTTNITVQAPGGFTNLNLTPKTVMYADVNDAESSIPNAAGVLTNNGSGGIGFSQSLSLSEVDSINFYPTNLFTGLTNAPLLSTDANGKLQNGSPLAATNVTFIAGANLTFTTNVDGSIVIASSGTITVTTVTNSTFVNTNVFISTSNAFFNLVYVTNLYSDIFTNNTFVNTNTVIITGKASVNTLIVTNVAIYGNLTNTVATASTVAAYDANKLLTNLPNAHGVLTNTASGPASFGLLQNTELANSSITIQGSAVALGGSTLAAGATPFFGGDNITNMSYIMKTNNGGGNALVAGSPGTALTCILTNITADTTLAAMTFWTAGMSVIPVYCSCSGGANKQLKFPANFQGSGDLYGIDLNGTGVTITNAEASWFEVRCIYGVKTNVFRSNTK